jgi:uncharacterized protein (DUF302 family)
MEGRRVCLTNHSNSSRKASGQTPQAKVEGMIHVACKYAVDETVERLRKIFEDNGVTLFFLMDHSGEAQNAGMEMLLTNTDVRPSCCRHSIDARHPSIAIDLPLKLLVWEDAEGMVWVSYNSPTYLQKRHCLPQHLNKAVEVVAQFPMKAIGQDK